MNAWLPVAEQALMSGLLNNRASFMRKNKFGLAFAALSGLLLFIGLAFAILSLYGWLLSYYAQPLAALIVSGIVIGASLVSGVTGYLTLRKKRRSVAHETDFTHIITEITNIIGEEWTDPIQQNPKTAMLLASLAGLVAGDRLH